MFHGRFTAARCEHEEVDLQDYLDLDDAQQHLDRFIGELYNRERLHSSLGSLPPVEFTARYPSQ
ncbi:integrase core domain-containing protein [Deinococcus ruber]|uniref:integrase core domain-containing protein n=1 Tax=Deinococcus ruber TaxID=1848197 RepID=UPI00166DADB4